MPGSHWHSRKVRRMSAEEMFQEISSHDGTMYYIAATNGPSDFAVVQSLMFGLEDNSKLTVRFTADTDVNLVYPSSDCCMSCEDGDKSYEGVTFDAIITRVHKLPAGSSLRSFSRSQNCQHRVSSSVSTTPMNATASSPPSGKRTNHQSHNIQLWDFPFLIVHIKIAGITPAIFY